MTPKTRFTQLTRAALPLLLLLASVWSVPAAHADDFFVLCNPAPLRIPRLIEAIRAANARPGLDTITLAPDCLYQFVAPLDVENGSAVPAITDDLVLRGQGATLQRHSEAPSEFRLLTIGNEAVVTLEDLVIRQGDTRENGPGGGIYAGPKTDLTLNQVRVENNDAGNGGGVAAEGALTIVGSHFTGNVSGSRGGGLFSHASLSVTRSRFQDNEAHLGGGIYALGPSQLVATSLLSNTSEMHGGGIFLDGAPGQIDGSVLVQNDGGYAGGGIYATNSVLTLTEVTLNRNAAERAGGIAGEPADVTLILSQVADNGDLSLDNAQGGLVIQGRLSLLTGTSLLQNGTRGAYVQGDVILSDARVIGNGGEGIYAFGQVTVENSQVSENGGIGVFAGDALTIRGSRFIRNAHIGAATGGAAEIENSLFDGNYSSTFCGAVATSGPARLSGNTFLRNSSDLFGGAVCVLSANAQSAVVNNLFVDNNAPVGAAIYALVDPSRPFQGGDDDTVQIFHNTIVHQAGPGSAVSLGRGQSLVVDNIITGHLIGLQGYAGSQVNADHNLFSANSQDVFGVERGPNDLTADPLFVDPPAEDFRLQAGSPAIDSGLGIDVLVDLAGVTRPQGSRPDRGAFEFVPAAPGLHQVWLPLIGR